MDPQLSEILQAPDPSSTAGPSTAGEPSVIIQHRERLLCLVAAGQSKAFLGKHFTLEYIERASDKEIEKYYKIYESTYSSLVSDNIVNGVLTGFSKLLGLVLPVNDVDKLSEDLKNNFLVTNQFRHFTGKLAYSYGPLLALTSGGFTILNNINFVALTGGHTCPKRSDLNGLEQEIEQVLEQELEQELEIDLKQLEKNNKKEQ